MAAVAGSGSPDDGALGKAYDARLVRRLLVYVRPYQLLVVAALMCIAVAAAMQLAGPFLTRWVIDRALPARDDLAESIGGMADVAVIVAPSRGADKSTRAAFEVMMASGAGEVLVVDHMRAAKA